MKELSNVNGQGSLTQFEGGKGYWFKVIEPIEFQFIMPTDIAEFNHISCN